VNVKSRRQQAAGSEQETTAGRRQRAQNAKRHAQSAGRTEEQEAGGSGQRAQNAKRNAQSARRLRPPAAGSEQETTVGRWQLAANTKQHRRRGAGRAGDVASIVARLDPRDVNEVCHGTELRVAGDEAGILADGGSDGKGVRI